MPLTAHASKFYIDGAWVDPVERKFIDVINPATEKTFTKIAAGSAADVDRAVAAAKRAFPSFSQTTKKQRLAWLRALLDAYNERYDEIAEAVCSEIGAPISLAKESQAAAGQRHLEATIKALEQFDFVEERDSYLLYKEAIGVAALITPWNWPLNQIATKVAPAIAAGCPMVLKPSEIAPISALVFAEAVAATDLPRGVFNLVNGTGPDVGQAMAGHPDVDMVSFTGSTRAGVMVAKTAADTVKRVCQELGGKCANIILPDADLEKAVLRGVYYVIYNSGQTCDAPTRLLVPANRHDEVLQIAKRVAEEQKVGDPRSPDTVMGPVVSEAQFNKIQRLIRKGIDEGATLVTGGLGRPDGLNSGYYVRPTIFGNVKNEMTIAREEIFGPVLSILPYNGLDEAVEIANDTIYGLAGYVYGCNQEELLSVAKRLRAGSVLFNDYLPNVDAPFGGYKQSGNGREYGEHGIGEFLELKAVVGYEPA